MKEIHFFCDKCKEEFKKDEIKEVEVTWEVYNIEHPKKSICMELCSSCHKEIKFIIDEIEEEVKNEK